MKKGRNRAYSNGELVILWQAHKCVHATTCFTQLRSVFDPVKRPWVNAFGASTERIVHIIEACPTDALTFRWVDEARNRVERSSKLFVGSLEEVFGYSSAADVPSRGVVQSANENPVIEGLEEEPATTVTLRPNGPIVIEGSFTLVGAGQGQPDRSWSMVSLCRCGRSSNMPHCDGTHFKEGFRTE